ncbi:hypothetical protein M1O15_08965 [Streptomyces lichenis]|uniref:Hydrogenase expression protein HypF n=1 Tax=Streptomyces lichenis TaxID=2306967 RepID=A0ABT0I869_9ACTN|nr:hypothetical protein [Streptomyces lichenis]MCK8677519.1 hypothetical protein [Streptomyces lichenis]
MAGGTVRGDENQPATRRRPRHAAPRKSLLSKLQAPAGKAMALAAMPTAVLVGFGLTPKLAMADDKDIPFAPGPCVTRSDEPEASESPSPSASESQSPKPSDTASPSPSPEPSESESAAQKPAEDTARPGKADEKPTPAESPSADESAKEPDGKGEQGATEPDKAPSPEPTESESRHPLDPLGVGNALEDLFGGIGGKDKAEPTKTPSSDTPSPSESSTKPSEKPDKSPEKPEDKPAEEASKDRGDEEDTAADKTKQAIKDAAEKAGAETEELPEDAKGLDPTKDEDIPDGAKPRFPCPTADPEALAAAELEPGIPLLPDDPWRLESTKLTLTGLDYHGIVEVKTYSGKIKKALKFTADYVGIKDLHQLTVHSEGHTGHVKSTPGKTSTIEGGTVTMYTEKLKGNLFGLIPVTFSPETPPPLNVPLAIFTDVEVVQAGQFGGNLTVPGLRNYVDG